LFVYILALLSQAKMFGQAFMMSEVKVQVDNEASTEIEQKAL
jgi:hypothetical protein